MSLSRNECRKLKHRSESEESIRRKTNNGVGFGSRSRKNWKPAVGVGSRESGVGVRVEHFYDYYIVS